MGENYHQQQRGNYSDGSADLKHRVVRQALAVAGAKERVRQHRRPTLGPAIEARQRAGIVGGASPDHRDSEHRALRNVAQQKHAGRNSDVGKLGPYATSQAKNKECQRESVPGRALSGDHDSGNVNGKHSSQSCSGQEAMDLEEAIINCDCTPTDDNRCGGIPEEAECGALEAVLRHHRRPGEQPGQALLDRGNPVFEQGQDAHREAHDA